MKEANDVNLFKEARLEAGLSIEGAALVQPNPACNWVTIPRIEAMGKTDFKMPQWGPKYLSALRTIAYENRHV